MAKQATRAKSKRLTLLNKKGDAAHEPTRKTKMKSKRKGSEMSGTSTGSEEQRGQRRKFSDLSEQERDRRRKHSDTTEQEADKGRSATDQERSGSASRALKPFFNRHIFDDPFFTEPWQDLFNFSSFNDMVEKARDVTKNAMKGARVMQKNIDTSHPGSYTSKSFYRTISGRPGEPEKREVISQETSTNVDKQGRKFTELWKNYEKDDEKKTTHSKMIGDKGVKEMRTHKLKTGEEFEHIDYRHMNEKDLHNFNSEFDRGIRNVKNLMPATSSFSKLLPDMSRLDRDMFPSPRMLGSSDIFADLNRETRPQSAMSEDKRTSRR